jgi:hypothetical protein
VASHDFQCSEQSVSEKKFNKELNTYKSAYETWRERGVLLIFAQFPNADFIFVTPNLKPPSVLFCVRINFTNYDVYPPSISFIQPFTRAPLKRSEVPIKFNQLILPEGFVPNPFQQIQPQDLLQGLPDKIPFFCIKGVREYHTNPRHTGDSWFLYRGNGEGKLGYLLDQLYEHSTAQVVRHQISLQPIIQFHQEIRLQ